MKKVLCMMVILAGLPVWSFGQVSGNVLGAGAHCRVEEVLEDAHPTGVTEAGIDHRPRRKRHRIGAGRRVVGAVSRDA